jgi:hypothetical protein
MLHLSASLTFQEEPRRVLHGVRRPRHGTCEIAVGEEHARGASRVDVMLSRFAARGGLVELEDSTSRCLPT